MPYNLDLLRRRRDEVSLHLKSVSNSEKAHQPKVRFLCTTFGLRGRLWGLLSLFTELPGGVLLGNPTYLTREEGCPAVAKARREPGSTTSTMMRTATTSVTAMRSFSAAPGAMTTPGAPIRKLSTQTTMVAQ